MARQGGQRRAQGAERRAGVRGDGAPSNGRPGNGRRRRGARRPLGACPRAPRPQPREPAGGAEPLGRARGAPACAPSGAGALFPRGRPLPPGRTKLSPWITRLILRTQPSYWISPTRNKWNVLHVSQNSKPKFSISGLALVKLLLQNVLIFISLN